MKHRCNRRSKALLRVERRREVLQQEVHLRTLAAVAALLRVARLQAVEGPLAQQVVVPIRRLHPRN